MPCPSDALWSQMIDETLDVDATMELRAHLESCEHCQRILDRLTEPATLREFGERTVSLSNVYPESLDTRLRILGRLASAGVGGARDEGASAIERPLDAATVVAGFRIDGVLGRGGIGIVYRGWDLMLDRPVALKCLRPERAQDGEDDPLVREARAAASLRHDHLVPVHGVERLPTGELMLVMPLIEGESLRQRINRDGCLQPRDAARIIAQVADALASLHASGLVHRDVKPGNILLDHADGRAKLTDFGLARLVPDSTIATRDGTRLIGTPEYICPDGIRDSRSLAKPSADIYSLGVTLYEALTGTLPFRGQTHRVLHQILSQDPPPPRSLNDEIPRDLETICLKAMASERANRYPTAAALRDDLANWLAGRPIAARPASAVEHTLRWMRRKPWQAGTFAAAFTLCVASVVAALMLHRAYADATRANQQLVAAQKLSDESFQLSQDALHRIVDRFSDQLFAVPNTTPLLLEAYNNSVQLHENLVKLRPNDLDATLGYGQALSRLCGIQMLHGAIPDAEQTYERYLEFARRQQAAFPSTPKVALMLVDALRCQETLANKQGQADRAQEATSHCRALLEELAQRHPQVPEVLQARVVDLMSLMTDQRRAKDYAQAVRTGQKAIALLERWRALVPDAPDPPQTLDFLWILQARSLESLGRLDEASHAARQAELAQQAPQLASIPQRDRDWSLVQLRKIQARIALAHNDESAANALAALESLLRDQVSLYPEEDGLREDLILTLRDRARLAHRHGDPIASDIARSARSMADRLVQDVPQVARYRELAASLEALCSETENPAEPHHDPASMSQGRPPR